jgi:hypothetical protein
LGAAQSLNNTTLVSVELDGATGINQIQLSDGRSHTVCNDVILIA